MARRDPAPRPTTTCLSLLLLHSPRAVQVLARELLQAGDGQVGVVVAHSRQPVLAQHRRVAEVPLAALRARVRRAPRRAQALLLLHALALGLGLGLAHVLRHATHVLVCATTGPIRAAAAAVSAAGGRLTARAAIAPNARSAARSASSRARRSSTWRARASASICDRRRASRGGVPREGGRSGARTPRTRCFELSRRAARSALRRRRPSMFLASLSSRKFPPLAISEPALARATPDMSNSNAHGWPIRAGIA